MKKFLFFIWTGFIFVPYFCKGEENTPPQKSPLAGKKVVMIIAPEDFRDEELKEPRDLLNSKGASVSVASKTTDEVTGMLGMKVKPDITIDSIKVDDYNAVIFVGGVGASVYFNDEKVLSIAKETFEKGKVIGAICIAPSILANAGVLKGKKATSYSSERKNLEEKGAIWTGEDVSVDGKIVTASGPVSAKKFGEKIAELLK